MNEQYERLVPLYGEAALDKLKRSTVAVIGLGGVGAHAIEALARMGVGSLVVMDRDVVVKSNLNRLLYGTHETIGQKKSTLARERIDSINPECEVIDYDAIFDENSVEDVFSHPLDYVFDAIDSVKNKALLIRTAKERGVPVISSVGQGNRRYSEKIRITDLFSTAYDPLARKLRAELRKNNIRDEVTVVYSEERPFKDGTLEFVASNPFGPATAGLRAAEHICLKLME